MVKLPFSRSIFNCSGLISSGTAEDPPDLGVSTFGASSLGIAGLGVSTFGVSTCGIATGFSPTFLGKTGGFTPLDVGGSTTFGSFTAVGITGAVATGVSKTGIEAGTVVVVEVASTGGKSNAGIDVAVDVAVEVAVDVAATGVLVAETSVVEGKID